MKKWIVAAGVLGLLFAPLAAEAHEDDYADDVNACKQADDTGVALGAVEDTNPDNADRGHACVAAEGTTVFYIGGEGQSEETNNPGNDSDLPDTGTDTGACGAIVVADTTLAGENGWDRETADDPDTDADETHHRCQ